VSRLVRILRGADEEFFELFERAGENVVRAAELLVRMLARFPDERGLASEISECETTGDNIVHATIGRLNHTFVTPIEREDILELTSALDDIVDFTEEVADYLGVYKIEAPTEQAQRLAALLAAAARQIAAAIPRVRDFADISDQVVEAHRLENEADRVLRDALGSLFEGGVDPMMVIRWKDIYERLESAIDATERAASILEGIVIKNA
jgi:uncharacterized protein